MSDLATEILSGDLAAECAPHVLSGDDGAIAEIFNRKDIPSPGFVPRATFATFLGRTGIRSTVEDVSVNASHPLRASALTILDFLRGGVASALDMGDANTLAMFQAWQDAEIVSQANLDELIVLGTTMKSKAEILGISVTAQDVAQALRP